MEGVEGMSFAEVQAKIQSDPIFGSIGGPSVLEKDPTPQQILEHDLASRTERTFEDDHMHPETQDSITTAEKLVGAKLELPTKTPDDIARNKMSTQDVIDGNDYEDDAEIKSTLKSAHQAEWLYGYHGYGYGGYRGGNR